VRLRLQRCSLSLSPGFVGTGGGRAEYVSGQVVEQTAHGQRAKVVDNGRATSKERNGRKGGRRDWENVCVPTRAKAKTMVELRSLASVST
jgi:hypothetical protein